MKPTPDASPLVEPLASEPGGSHPPTTLEQERAITPGGPTPTPVSDDVPQSLRSWDHYRVEELIGVGGMGRVYRAWDARLRRRVALKFLRSGDAAVEQRFEREAQAQARVQHPNVCAVYEVDRHDGQPYIAMQFIQGRTLREVARELPVRDRVRLMRDVAEAVHAAHRSSLVHRDIKPANILVEQREGGPVPFVTDFGLARDLTGPGVTQAGAIIGTPQYMAPEQVRGDTERLDARTDVYGLGATLYDALAGAPPFAGSSNLQTLYRTLNDEAPPLRKWNKELPAPLEAVVMKCLEKKPERRYATARELADDLGRWLNGEPVLARPQGLFRRTVRRLGRNPVALASAALLGLAAAVPVALSLRDPGAPATVAVADFVNETRDPDLDGLSGMLITSLEQSQRLSVLTRSRMRDILRQVKGVEGRGRIDEAMGREVARYASADALLLATIRRFDDLYSIEVQALDPRSTAVLFEVKEEGHGKQSVPALLDRVSRRAQRQLKRSAREGGPAVSAVTTGSLEAYQHYFRSEELIDRVRFREAQVELRRAIAADPDFALAHYRMAYSAMWLKDGHAAIESVERAARLIERVPERERYLILALRATLTGHGAEAVEQYQKCLQRFPQEKEAAFNLGDLSFHSGAYEPAIAYLRRTLELDGANERALQHLVWAYELTGRHTEMLSTARAYAELVHTASANATLGRALAASGNLAAARARHEAGSKRFADSPLPLADLSALEAWEGRTDAAQAIVEPLLAKERPWEHRKLGLQAVAEAQTLAGQVRLARQTLDALASEALMRRDSEAAAIARAMQGFTEVQLRQDLGAARDAIARAHAERLPEAPLGFVYPYLGEFDRYVKLLAGLGDPNVELELRAFTRRLRGEHALAIADFRDLAQRTPFIDVLGYETGAAQLEAHQNDKAAETFARVLGTWPNATVQGLGLTVAVRPRALFGLAMAQERLGQAAKARESYERLLKLWGKADPDLPDLLTAKAHLATLRTMAAR